MLRSNIAYLFPFLLMLVFSCAGQTRNSDRFPEILGWVSDYDNLYTPSEKHSLDSLLTSFEKQTTIEIALVTLRPDMLKADSTSLKKYSLAMANEWRVGKKDTNNGILIAISNTYRNIRINNGYGIEEVITDEETKEIIDNGFLPDFKKGKMYEGTFNGIKCLMSKLVENMDKKNIRF